MTKSKPPEVEGWTSIYCNGLMFIDLEEILGLTDNPKIQAICKRWLDDPVAEVGRIKAVVESLNSEQLANINTNEMALRIFRPTEEGK